MLRSSFGRGSKVSKLSMLYFLTLPYSNWACDTCIAASLRFRGGFHWQGRDVTGGLSSSLSSSSCMITVGFRATSACSRAETCTQLAERLYMYMYVESRRVNINNLMMCMTAKCTCVHKCKCITEENLKLPLMTCSHVITYPAAHSHVAP